MIDRSVSGPAFNPVQGIGEQIGQRMPARRVLRAYLLEMRYECLRYLRTPSFILPTLLFPTVFYLLFGIFLAHSNGADATRYLLASYLTFGVMAPGLFGFGVSLALERDGGLLTFKRALPMPPGAYLLAKMAMAMVVAGAISLLLLGMALWLAHAPLNPTQVLAVLASGLLGVLPFCAMGLLLGSLIKGQGAPGMVNLVYLPMSFLSGLWFPLSMLPGFLQRIAPLWPSYHLDQLALQAVGLSRAAAWPHLLVLLGVTLAFLGLAARRLRRYG